MPNSVGDPDMVNTFPLMEPVIPFGKEPLNVAPEAVPPIVNTILVKVDPRHKVGEALPEVSVMVCVFTVIVPVLVAWAQVPVVVIV